MQCSHIIIGTYSDNDNWGRQHTKRNLLATRLHIYAIYKTKYHAEKNTVQELSICGDEQPFGHNRHGPKSGRLLCAPRSVGELGPHLTQYHLGRSLPPYQMPSWSIQPFGSSTPTAVHQRFKQDSQDMQDNGPVAQDGPLLVTVVRPLLVTVVKKRRQTTAD